ncbi:putative LysR family transcriptional regulator [Pandoraea thiooxydans]|uniref:LysR family transcriptional regulator n=1 Tax=Pandoraea thiooxydans TaxID=445709 RepID=A0A0G3ET58_9BURK|nr:LysR family transcriptional regulator [Pandoraea thiooxydans]AKJ70145.1 LysR family transcriptional regulator [Pandoraea thiooxydans]APR93583.1 putative LysR family transcriptional regulator [Pandoraea thiooxydans]
MDHSTLEIFCVVAEELSITRAAQRLGRVQSNVTTRIQQLEEELGAALFLRDNKRLRLSPQGEKFLGYAQSLLALAEEARQVLHPGVPEGLLSIGSMESTAASRLPAVLARYHRQWPEVQIRLCTNPSRQLLEALQARAIDCALVALPLPAKDEAPLDLAQLGLAGQPVFGEELMLVLPADHRPVKTAKDLTVRSLAAFRGGCTYRAFAEDWLREASGQAETPFDIQEVGSYHAMLACVASGTCVSVIPRSVIELTREPAAVRLVALGRIDTWLVWRDGYETPAFGALREALAQAREPRQRG